MMKDKEEAKMLSEHKQPKNMKPFKVDEHRIDMNHILNEREDVVVMIKIEKRNDVQRMLKEV